MKPQLDARNITLMAMMAALVFVTIVFLPKIPVGIGNFNLSDTAIYFAAFAFGPWVGLVAGGLGGGMADVASGYSEFAPLTFIAHGLQGFLAGYFIVTMKGNVRYMIGWAAGAVAMVGGYFLGEALVEVWGGIGQATTEVTANLLQVVSGGIVGYALLWAVRRAYPQIDRLQPK